MKSGQVRKSTPTMEHRGGHHLIRGNRCRTGDQCSCTTGQSDSVRSVVRERILVKTASDDKAPEVAVGWRERKLNGKYEFKWLYVGKFAEGISEEASTKEGKLSPTTKSIKGSFYERSIDNLYEVSVDESNLVAEDTDAATAIKRLVLKSAGSNGRSSVRTREDITGG